MTAINTVISTVKANPLLVAGGTLAAVFLLSLGSRGGGGGGAQVTPEHTLASQKIAADTNVALAGIQAQRDEAYVSLAGVAAGRDVALYDGAVQAYLGKSATDAAIAGFAYNYAGQSLQSKTAIAINELQADVVNNQTRSILTQSLAGISAGYAAARDALGLEAKRLDVEKSLGFRQLQSADYAVGVAGRVQQHADSLQAQNQTLAINAGRDVAFKSLDVDNLASQRNFQVELEVLKQLPAIQQHQGNLAVLQSEMFTNQLFSNERVNAAQLETMQYVTKKTTNTGLLSQIVSGGFNLAGGLIGSAR